MTLAPVTSVVAVGEDPEEPGFEVGAPLKRAEPAAGGEGRLLHQVLGVRPVPQQPQREPVRPREQRREHVVERRRSWVLGARRARERERHERREQPQRSRPVRDSEHCE